MKKRDLEELHKQALAKTTEARNAYHSAVADFWTLARFVDPELVSEIKAMNYGLYSQSFADWSDDDRKRVIRTVRRQKWDEKTNSQKLEQLFKDKYGS